MAGNKNAPLSVTGLNKRYPSFELKEVTFDLAEGKITGFIGRNGAGKTTTINSILGFVKPDGGEVLFRGETIGEREHEIRKRIGFVSAGMTYYTRKKLSAITAVTRSFYPEWDDGAYRRYLEAFGLSDDKTPAELSNGMKIKYALTLALSHGAELLILDEPTSGLDPVSREELVEVFLRLRDEGKTVLFSTHITSDLEKCADRILFLQQGELKADDDLDAFRYGFRIVEAAGDIAPELQEVSMGACRTREGYTVLIPAAEQARFDSREATLEEIMVHLEKEAEEA